MGSALQLVNGVPRMTTVSGTTNLEIRDEGGVVLASAIALDFKGLSITASDGGSGVAEISVRTDLIYDETYIVQAGGITTGTAVTLPKGGVYESTDLIVELNGKLLKLNDDFSYVGTIPNRTQVSFQQDLVEGDAVGFRKEHSASSVYQEFFPIPGGGWPAGVDIALPSAQTYTVGSNELAVYYNGQLMEPGGIDYDETGTTTIAFVDALYSGDQVLFLIEDSGIAVYDETTVVGAGGIMTGTEITLPNSGKYDSEELEVYLNGDNMDIGIDWCNQSLSTVAMTFDLVEGDSLRFRITGYRFD